MRRDRIEISSGKRSRSRVRLFRAITILLPFFILALLELTLRLSGYGHDLGLFVPDKQYPDCLVMNRHVSERYFNDPANATVGNSEPFRRQKAAGTMRIFVLGESTAIGFPYMHNGSFHRQLQYRLMQMYPATDFEIINLSLTAVNSFTVRDLAPEIAGLAPDAVLIYCGHNEYYGALGVASTSHAGNSSWLIRSLITLRRLRTVQLLFHGLHSMGAGSKQVDTTQNLMERMAREQKIPFRSATYRRGIEQFHDNMSAACKTLSEHHIPIFLSTVVSNEKDLAPFISSHDSPADDADSCYRKGINAYRIRDFLTAKRYFVAAKELDLLRFRAPEAINRQIEIIARRFPGVYLVDSKRIFEAEAPYGIVGNNLLLEHVHPTLAGYGLLSDAFFNALSEHHVLPKTAAVKMNDSELKREVPLTTVDSLFGEYTITLLKARWPFNQKVVVPEPATSEQALAYDMAVNHLPWKDAMERLMGRYELLKDSAGMLKVAEAVMLEYPLEPTFYVVAGRLSAAARQYEKARNYWGRATRKSR